MKLSEILKLAVDGFKASKMRFALTALAWSSALARSSSWSPSASPAGNSSSNRFRSRSAPTPSSWKYAGGGATPAERVLYNDYLTRLDEKAVDQQVPGVMYSSLSLKCTSPSQLSAEAH